MGRKWNTAIGFYQSSHTAKSVLNKLRSEGFNHSIAVEHSHSGELKANLFSLSRKQIAITASLIIALLGTAALAFFKFSILPLLIVILLFGGWLSYLISIYKANAQMFKSYKNCIISDETLILSQVKDKDVRKALNIIRKVEFHPISFLIRPDSQSLPKPLEDNYHEPLPIENFQADAIKLAASLKNISFKKTSGNPLLASLEIGAKKMGEIQRIINEAEYLEQSVGLSSDWFLDNMYIIQGCIEEIRRGLNRKYYRELPKVAAEDRNWPYNKTASTAKLPRIYLIANEIIKGTGNRLTRENITAFLNSYQSVSYLTIGELWALPLMLKLRLLELIQTLAENLEQELRETELANFWGNRLLNVARREPQRVGEFIEILKGQIPNPSPLFAEELVDHLFDEDAVSPVIKEWIEDKLKMNWSEIIQKIQLKKTTNEVTFSSSIISLINISQLPWNDVFESVSPVDAILKDDPARIYNLMDFSTRDFYRHALESLSRRSNHTEIEVAETLLQMGREGKDETTKHVGYYLIDKGRLELESQLHCTPKILERVRRQIHAHSSLYYIGGITALTTLITGLLAYFSVKSGTSFVETSLLILLALFPASEIAVQFINYLIPWLFPPYFFPKMSYEKGIPEKLKTLVVIPTMLSEASAIDKVVDQLEIHYLANPDPVLKFGIVFDWKDAPSEVMPEDASLLEHALKRMQKLAEKYDPHKFFLFLRSRVWSNTESCWIGEERKRGKLEA